MTDREIDALVAEKVMGIEPGLIHTGTEPERVQYEGREYIVAPIEHYSADIAAAFDIVEKLKAEGWQVGIQTFWGNWKALLAKHDVVKYSGFGHSPAKALCLAALKAKGVEVE